VTSLLALDLPLGPTLVEELTECAMTSQAFCIIDQRLSPRAREAALVALGATHVRDDSGTTTLSTGAGVDEGDALVMLTSGSSGAPKAAIHTWESLIASAALTQSTLRGEVAPIWMSCLPPSHIGGLAVLLRSVLNDAELRFGDDLSSGPTMGATHIAVVRPQLARYDLSEYQVVLVGGAKPPSDVPANVRATWGLTETGSGIVYDGLPLPDVEVRSLNGELCVRTPTLFRSYRDSARPAVTIDGVEWFPTGDAGDVIDGRVSVRGRLAFVITTGGEKVWPDDVEQLFATASGVRDVAITGVDDDEWGQRVVALVVADSPIDDELKRLAHEHIGPWAKPKEIRYVAAIPRTANGKIRRDALAHLH